MCGGVLTAALRIGAAANASRADRLGRCSVARTFRPLERLGCDIFNVFRVPFGPVYDRIPGGGGHLPADDNPHIYHLLSAPLAAAKWNRGGPCRGRRNRASPPTVH